MSDFRIVEALRFTGRLGAVALAYVFLCSAFGLAPALSQAKAQETELSDVPETTLLNEQILFLNDLGRLLLRPDRARVNVLRQEVERARDTLVKLGPVHLETTKAFFQYHIYFKYSGDFFKRIHAPSITDHLLASYQEIVRRRGLDEGPFLSTTESIFFKVRDHFEEIKKSPNLSQVSADFLFSATSTLNRVDSDLGNLIALAKARGDVLETFLAAREFYVKWVVNARLYDHFDRHMNSQDMEAASFQIMGLLEFYSAFVETKGEELGVGTGSLTNGDVR